jgi:hypothetical protein
MNNKDNTTNQPAKKIDPLFLIGLLLSLVGFTFSIIKLLKL